ncbi:MAG: ornithine cyclodeaminase family protein [Pirellulaceae bacterium]|nr:ornithine cyclodeaminase family protein [Pirellulaceae bacterium]MDP7016694.1 ornithine cyclodeaminase family protein [Pirellulaceae bacterium]
MLHLTEADVDRLLDMPAAIEAMEGAFRALAAGQAKNLPRRRVPGDGVLLHSMEASADYLGLLGWKHYTTRREGARFHVGLYEQSTGEMVALIEADRLGQLRTGAVTGLACKWLSAPQSRVAAIIGSGWQAESQLAAVAAVAQLDEARVYSRSVERRLSFAERMSADLGLSVRACDSVSAATADAQIVVTATTSKTPVLEIEHLASDSLVCAIGSNWLQKSELGERIVEQASLVICDSVDCCREEAGDLQAAVERDEFEWSDARELADVVAGRVAVTSDGFGHRVFKSVGMAIEDVAIAHVARCRATGDV